MIGPFDLDFVSILNFTCRIVFCCWGAPNILVDRQSSALEQNEGMFRSHSAPQRMGRSCFGTDSDPQIDGIHTMVIVSTKTNNTTGSMVTILPYYTSYIDGDAILAVLRVDERICAWLAARAQVRNRRYCSGRVNHFVSSLDMCINDDIVFVQAKMKQGLKDTDSAFQDVLFADWIISDIEVIRPWDHRLAQLT